VFHCVTIAQFVGHSLVKFFTTFDRYIKPNLVRMRCLLLIFSVFPLVVFAQDPSSGLPPIGSSKNLKDECIACHTGVQHKDLVSKEKLEKCQECHTDQQHMQEALKQVPESYTQHKPASQIQNRQRPDIGMSLPLYYPNSRLGDAPNDMVLVPAGEFIMGTNSRLPDEGPEHTVTLPAFYIDKYEVTNLQYKKFNDATKRRSPTHFRNRTFPQGKADHPVTYVSWLDAKAYCEWAGKRLPTDGEWEKAARGTDGRWFPWGNEFDYSKSNSPVRWGEIGVFGDTTPVGAFEGGASPYGVYDMSGNVWEWTASWYQPYPGNTVASESYGERYKVLKGGSWFDCSFYNCGISAPVFNRAFFAKRTKNDSFGFRCAKDADDINTTENALSKEKK
jgi:formylglycine-generating enzyme required for sulfatase activity